MFELLPYAVRLIHITSVILLMGGLFYAWNLSKAQQLPKDFGAGFVPAVWALVVAIFLTGFYNFFTKGPVPKTYHMIFGIKFLLALHIAAIAIILAKPSTTAEKRAKLLPGLAISGFLAIALASALRALTL